MGVRALDRATIDAGTTGLDLMERAGAALADILDNGIVAEAAPRLRRSLARSTPRLLVVAGAGNNGGDGSVVARLLAARGWEVTVAFPGALPTGEGEAAANLERWRAEGGRVLATAEGLGDEAHAHGLILDCMFGTGLTRDLAEPWKGVVRELAATRVPVVACDIASGLCADTGAVLGAALAADATATIGAAKPGLFLGSGPDLSGRVHVLDIALEPPAAVGGVVTFGRVLTRPSLAAELHPRPSSFHKGQAGHVLVVAGSKGKAGAASLAARGALRAGAGLVTLAVPESLAASVPGLSPEVMVRALPGNGLGSFAAAAADELGPALAGFDAVALGPGMGTGEGSAALLREVVSRARGTLVLDADALNILAGLRSNARAMFEDRRARGLGATVLTPHPGEMARLVATSSGEVQAHRLEVARDLVREWGTVVVLKGAATLVAAPEDTAWNTTGNPAMASPGMGDVLAGVIAAFAAAGQGATAAARTAVWAHGRAADLLYDELAAPGFLASEVADALPHAMAELLS